MLFNLFFTNFLHEESKFDLQFRFNVKTSVQNRCFGAKTANVDWLNSISKYITIIPWKMISNSLTYKSKIEELAKLFFEKFKFKDDIRTKILDTCEEHQIIAIEDLLEL